MGHAHTKDVYIYIYTYTAHIYIYIHTAGMIFECTRNPRKPLGFVSADRAMAALPQITSSSPEAPDPRWPARGTDAIRRDPPAVS